MSETIREGKHEDTFIILPGQTLKFHSALGETAVPGKYKLTVEYRIEKLPHTFAAPFQVKPLPVGAKGEPVEVCEVCGLPLERCTCAKLDAKKVDPVEDLKRIKEIARELEEES